MRYIIVILTALLSFFCFNKAKAQCTSIFGNNNPACYVKTVNGLWMPIYATTDTNDVLGFDSEGKAVLRKKSAGVSVDTSLFAKKADTNSYLATKTYVNNAISSIPTPTLQQVATSGNTYTGTISAGKFIGTSSVDNGTPDANILVNRTLSAGSTAGHAMRDQTTFSRSNTGGYNSFDGAATISGKSNNHAVSFQHRMSVTDSLYRLYGYFDECHIYDSVAEKYGVYYRDYLQSGYIGKNAGMYIEPLTKAITNKAIVTQGNTSSNFGNDVYIGAAPWENYNGSPFFSHPDSNVTSLYISSSDTFQGKFPAVNFTYKAHSLGSNVKSDIVIATDQIRMFVVPQRTQDSNFRFEVWRRKPSLGISYFVSDTASGVLSNLTSNNYSFPRVTLVKADTPFLRYSNNAFNLNVKSSKLTAHREIYQPDKSGTYALLSDLPTPLDTTNFAHINGDSKSSNFSTGTNDAFAYGFETNGLTRGFITNAGVLRYYGGTGFVKMIVSGNDEGSGDGVTLRVQNTTNQPVSIAGYEALDSITNIYARYRVSTYQDLMFGLGIGSIQETNGNGFYFSRWRANNTNQVLLTMDSVRLNFYPNGTGIVNFGSTFTLNSNGRISRYGNATPALNEILVGDGNEFQTTTPELFAVSVDETPIIINTTITPTKLFTIRPVDATSGNVTITVNATEGQMVEIKRIDNSANIVTVQGQTGQIDYQASVTIPAADLVSTPNVLPTLKVIKGTTNYFILN